MDGAKIYTLMDGDTLNIYNIEDKTNQVVVQVYMRVSFYDYVINTVSGEVTRGTKQRKLTNNYILTFVKSKDSVTNNCPNCGAPNKGNTSSTCEYCDSVMIGDSEETIGELVFFMEMMTAFMGEMMDVDAFDQPGVEAYKQNMFELLGKPQN